MVVIPVVAPAGHNTTSFGGECSPNDDASNGMASSTSAIRAASLSTIERVVKKSVTDDLELGKELLMEIEKTPALSVNLDITEDTTNSLPATCDMKSKDNSSVSYATNDDSILDNSRT